MNSILVFLLVVNLPALAGEKMFWQKSSLAEDIAAIQKVEKELPGKAAKISQDGERAYSDFDGAKFKEQMAAYAEILGALENEMRLSDPVLKKENRTEAELKSLRDSQKSICEKSKSLEDLRAKLYEKFHPRALHPKQESKNWVVKNAQKLKARWGYDIFGFLGIKVSDEKSEASFSKAIVASASACDLLAGAAKPAPAKIDDSNVASEPAPAQWSGFPAN